MYYPSLTMFNLRPYYGFLLYYIFFYIKKKKKNQTNNNRAYLELV